MPGHEKDPLSGGPKEGANSHHRDDGERVQRGRARALDAGMNDHVAKPIDMDLLVTTLLKYL